MNIEFKKYSKMENSYRDTSMERMIQAMPHGDDTQCQITEKIHGANFGIYCDGETIKPASRNQFVDGTFNNCQEVLNRYEDGFFGVWDSVKNEGEEVIIFGELAGGNIQTGVKYGDRDFFVFDIKVNGSYLPTLIVEQLCKDHNLKHSPVLVPMISFKEALLFDQNFQSKILVVEGDNFAEGIVIKPVIPAFLPTGARCAVKKKNENFSEISRGKKEKVVLEPMADTDLRMVEDISLYLNENRLRAVMSKLEQPTQKDFGKISGLLLQDALEDFEGDYDIEVKKMATEYTRVAKAMRKLAVDTLRPFWVDMLEGEF